MIIFDPFYCQGSVLRNLAALGFTNVINAKQVSFFCIFLNWNTLVAWSHLLYQDFYSNPVPKYDVLLTNPPYRQEQSFGVTVCCARPIIIDPFAVVTTLTRS